MRAIVAIPASTSATASFLMTRFSASIDLLLLTICPMTAAKKKPLHPDEERSRNALA